MKVALLGPEGTYTHQAAASYFEDLETDYCSTIRDVFNSDTEVKFVPVENSLGGGVSDTVELLKSGDDTVTAEVRLQIQHALISDEDSIEDIERIKSHPQALSQCQNLIEEHGWEKEETGSTAAAVEQLEEGEAALASEIAAEINDKNILETSVQDTDSNITRFFVLNGDPEPEEKTALVLEPGEDRPGLLHAMLSCFAGHQVNLTHIQSRPTKRKLGEYYFYVEADAAGEKLQDTIDCLETYAEVQNLGSFSVLGDET
ncbi:prephenate dehydratase [Candidatus Nanohalobium constans]|uniref:Prephenate dehydratase n=1 Tax=Candidatus Nanohalobium constans TaxID=2565781 RepID=A0A5Q0UEJ1_9ARCH|nr:prephenate dehydratase domain-containing protein [Candidatus Nanohalobium constans]QGA79983.1 prephenate dehydratase [Candidatus Nanohalobium constans]